MSLKNPVTPPGIDPETIRLNHYATPGPQRNYIPTINIDINISVSTEKKGRGGDLIYSCILLKMST